MRARLRRATGACAAALLVLAGIAASTPAMSSAGQPVPALVTNIRAGSHQGFDRIVLDIAGPLPQVSHRFVDELIAEGSGDVVWLTGEQFALVTLNPAAAHDGRGDPTYLGPWKFRTWRLDNVMAVAITGDIESYLSLGLGLRHQAPVTVFTVDSPARVVIDVGH